MISLRQWTWAFAFVTVFVLLTNSAHAANRDLSVTLQQTTSNPVITRTKVNYNVTIRNDSSQQPANNVLVHVTFNVLFSAIEATPAAGGLTCSVNVVGGTSKVVACNTSQLAGGEQKSFKITATAPTRQLQSTVTAQADPNNTVNEANEANNSATVTTSSVEIADLDPDLSGSTLEVTSGAEIKYEVKVKNIDDKTSTTVGLRATLPQQVDFVRTENETLGSCTRQGQDINCLVTAIAKDQTKGVRIVARPLALLLDGTQISFAVNVDPNNTLPERNEQNNTAFVITTVRARADLQITGTFKKEDAPTPPGADPGPGGQVGGRSPPSKKVTLNLQVKNNGPGQSPAGRVLIAWPAPFDGTNDPCPTGQALVGNNCVDGAIKVSSCFRSCGFSVLAPGSAVNLSTFGFVANDPGTAYLVQCTISLDNPASDTNTDNNVVTFTIQIP